MYSNTLLLISVQVFMISSMKTKFKEVVTIVPVKGLTGDQLCQMTRRVLETLHGKPRNILSLLLPGT